MGNLRKMDWTGKYKKVYIVAVKMFFWLLSYYIDLMDALRLHELILHIV